MRQSACVIQPRAIAAGLSDRDMADLAAYYASDSLKSAAK